MATPVFQSAEDLPDTPNLRCVVSHDCMLEAVGDEQQLLVFRSPIVDRDDDRLIPVWEHIRDHDLELVDQELIPCPAFMFGKCEISWYLSRVTLRDGLLSAAGPHPLRTMWADAGAFWSIVR